MWLVQSVRLTRYRVRAVEIPTVLDIVGPGSETASAFRRPRIRLVGQGRSCGASPTAAYRIGSNEHEPNPTRSRRSSRTISGKNGFAISETQDQKYDSFPTPEREPGCWDNSQARPPLSQTRLASCGIRWWERDGARDCRGRDLGPPAGSPEYRYKVPSNETAY